MNSPKSLAIIFKEKPETFGDTLIGSSGDHDLRTNLPKEKLLFREQSLILENSIEYLKKNTVLF